MENDNVRVISYIVAIVIVVVAVALAIIIPMSNNDDEKEDEVRDFYVLRSDGKEGVITGKGETIIEPKYTQIIVPDIHKRIFCTYDEDQNIIVIDENENRLFKEYEKIEVVEGNNKGIESPYRPVLKFKKDGKYGLLSLDGKELTKPIYDEITSVENDFNNYKVKQNGKYGLLSDEGKVLLKTEYEDIQPENNYIWERPEIPRGYKIILMGSNGPLEGFATSKGKIIVPVKYESVKKLEIPSEDYYVSVQEDGKKGVFKNSRQIIKSEYQEVSNTNNNIILKKYGKYGMTDLNGKEIIGQRFVGYAQLGDYIAFSDNDKEYAFDKEGNSVGKGMYKIIEVVADGKYIIAENYSGERVLQDREGNKVLSEKLLDIIYAFGDVFIGITDDGYGIYKAYEGVKLEPEYEYINTVMGANLIFASKNEGQETKLFDGDLNQVDVAYDFGSAIIQDIVKIFDDKNTYYYNFEGKEVHLEDELEMAAYPFKENDKWGFKDKNGNTLVEAKYDRVSEFNNQGFAGIMLDGKWGSIDSEFNVVLEPQIEFDANIIPQFVGKYLVDSGNTIIANDFTKSVSNNDVDN